MKSDPTADQVAIILRLLAQAGSVANLRRWIAVARKKPKRRRGRPAVPMYPDDFGLLLGAAILKRHNPQLSRSKAITHIVTTCCGDDGVKGISMNTVEKRLLVKLGGQSLADFLDAWVKRPDTKTLTFNSSQPSNLSA